MDSLRLHYENARHLLQSEAKARQAAEAKVIELNAQLASARAKIEKLENEKKQLEEDKEQLEREKNLKQPLYRVGVNARVRFLELAREYVLFTNRKHLRADAIEMGNKAAHNGNGISDALLFSQFSHGSLMLTART
jgi:chromosome segregation ATPase